MATEQDHASKALMVLQKAVANALERKRRLGQYAVLWRDGQTVRVPPKQLGSVGQYAPGDFTSPFTVRAGRAAGPRRQSSRVWQGRWALK